MKKSVYLFFCAVLGALLLLVIERAFSLLYFLLYNIDYGRYGFDLSIAQVQQIDLIVLIAAVVIGGIYGLWLGRHWYAYVYEGGREAQIKSSKSLASSPKSPSVPVVSVRPRRSKADRFAYKEPSGTWEVEDLMKTAKTPSLDPLPIAPEILSTDHLYDSDISLPKDKPKVKRPARRASGAKRKTK